MRGRLVLGTADGWLKADGETIYQATDLRVGLSKEKSCLNRALPHSARLKKRSST